MAPEQSRQARRIIRKLSEASESLPSSLFVTGVSGRDPHPLFAGGYGDIYRAEYRTGTVALKHMRHFMQTSDLRDIRLKLCREALVWKDLRHPNILKFIGIDRDSFPDSLCLVSPWMEHGTVLNYLKDHGRANVDKVLFEVAQGLEYLHSHDVVHGDLRGANILIKDDWCACLADFGLSVLVFATTSGSSTQAGSVYWMAPELIDPPRFGCRYARTPASDVYAFGCVCFELHTGHPPLSDLSEAATLLKVVNGERADRPAKAFMLSDVLWDHIASYWAQIPAERPPSDTVVRQMTWPHARNSSRPLPAIPCSPTTTASGPLVSSPLHYRSDSFETLPPYNSARGSRNYTGQYHFNRDEELQVEETAVTAEVESQDHDLGRMIELLGKAAERTMGNQSVILEGGMETRLEQARKRATEKVARGFR
ncbi:kinase-like domain-containing protein [Roridomyces roridus]|uniref:Kinase-like domain-containing protein n=1 Tax=Roridomyces roridus TaxID=1738132 RepID=A0AAD7FHN9_9AGAR|nr:kinase-like domain-containing protein [Roridomyces roridus]